MGDRGGIAFALKVDLGLRDRPRGIGQKHKLKVHLLRPQRGGKDRQDQKRDQVVPLHVKDVDQAVPFGNHLTVRGRSGPESTKIYLSATLG